MLSPYKTRQFFFVILLLFITWPVHALERGPQGAIRVGVFPVEPLAFVDKQGVAQGLFPDLLREIVKDESSAVAFVPGSWAEGLERLQKGEIDLILSVALSPERAEIMDFNYESVVELWGQVFVNPEGKSKNINDLDGRKVAVMRKDITGSNFIMTTKKLDMRCEIVEFATHAEVFTAVMKGAADAGVAPQHIGLRHAKEYNLVGSSIIFSPFSVFFASKKGMQKELLSHIDAHISNWKKNPDSVYYNRLNYWIGGQKPVTKIPVWLIYASIIGVFAILLFVGFTVLLKKTVRIRTKELQESEAVHSKMIANIGDVIVIIDRNGINRYKSPNIEKWFGWKPEDVVGFNTWDNVHPSDLEKSQTFIGELALTPNASGTTEVRYRCKDGSYKWIEITIVNLLHDTKINGFLGNYQDITKRKQTEAEREKLQAQLNQAQKIESVGRLAGGVAHDFNNMLGVILGYTELSMERVEPEDPLHANLEKIHGAAQRSADLTRQLLAFARKQTVSPKVIDLNDTIENILKLLLRLIGEDIDLAWQPGKEVWSVKIDSTQVDQILTNLCVNARDAISDLGKVTIETGNTVFDEDYCRVHAGFVPGEYVMLAVSDNGCGMDEETQAHLFEPFFTTKEMGKGTGLGLATVYGVVKQNNGFIIVYSELGQGTTFKIYLPRHLAKAVPLPEKVPDNPGKRGHEIVMLVEDEPANLEMITMMLESLGYTVLAAGTPSEAVRLAQEHRGRIDLLLTDVVMPEMNGRDLADKITVLYPSIKLLFMSGYTANVIANQGVLDDGVAFIQKPFSKADIAMKLRGALEG